MANTVRIKRRAAGGSAGAPTTLANAELAYNESDAGNGILYYGYGTGGVGGSATQIVAIGGDGAYVSLSGAQTISGNKTFTGSLNFSGATIDQLSTTGNVVVGGNLTVNGTTTTVNSTTVTVDDKNIELGSVTSPTDAGADGGGITLKGTTDKTFNWVDATDAWTSSEHLNLLTGKAYYINGASVLNNNTLGSGVTASSLTSVGTLTSGALGTGFTTVATAQGGTGQTTYTAGQLLIGKTDGTLAKATLTAGSNVTITNADGGITIAASDQAYLAGDGLDLTTDTFSLDLKANGGLVIESTELALDLGASSITGTLAVGDGGTGQTSYTDGQLLIGNTSTGGLGKATLTAGSNVTITNSGGGITIAATDTDTTYTAGNGLDLTGTEFAVDLKANGGLVIESTEIAVDLGASSITGTLAVGDGGTGQTSYTDGQLLIGNTATGGLSKATLTAGTNVTITNTNGAISIAATDTNTTYTAGDGLDLTGTEFSLDIRSGRGLQITSTELDLDDDLATLAGMQTGAATALAALTSTEVAVIDGGTSATATTLATGDRMVINDAGTMKQVALSDLVTFLEDGATSGFDIDGGTF
jgi:hypothetical protein